jgi:hypothetical protein
MRCILKLFITISTRKRKKRGSTPVVTAQRSKERSSAKNPSPGHNQNNVMIVMTATLIPAMSQMVRTRCREWRRGKCQTLDAMALETLACSIFMILLLWWTSQVRNTGSPSAVSAPGVSSFSIIDDVRNLHW